LSNNTYVPCNTHSVHKRCILPNCKVEAAGGQALPLMVNIQHEEQIQKSIEKTVEKFGGIDIVINNASAINLTGTQETPMKKFDLMHSINTRGTYLV